LIEGDRGVLTSLEKNVVGPLTRLLGEQDPLVRTAKEAIAPVGAAQATKTVTSKELEFINGFSDDLLGNPHKWNVVAEKMEEMLRRDPYWKTRLPPSGALQRLLSNLPSREGVRDPDRFSDQWAEVLQSKLTVSDQNRITSASESLRSVIQSRFNGLHSRLSDAERNPEHASLVVATLKKEFPQQWKQFEDSIRNGTYSDEAKAALLQHPEQLLSQYWSGNAGGVDSGMRDTSSRLFTWSLPAR